jgi:hypothetical protein
MRKNETFSCEKCDSEFYSEQDCLEHEEICGKSIMIKCDKCSKEEDIADDECGWKSEGWHGINLGRQGYGSGLDGCDVNFTICDDCLMEFINSFTVEGREKVLNSGRINTYHQKIGYELKKEKCLTKKWKKRECIVLDK